MCINTTGERYFMLCTTNYLSNKTSQRDMRRGFVCFKVIWESLNIKAINNAINKIFLSEINLGKSIFSCHLLSSHTTWRITGESVGERNSTIPEIWGLHLLAPFCLCRSSSTAHAVAEDELTEKTHVITLLSEIKAGFLFSSKEEHDIKITTFNNCAPSSLKL